MNEFIDTSLDKEFITIDNLNWLPFIGKNYFNENPKILVIGESHYIPLDEDPEFYNDKNWTRYFILKEGLQIKPWNQNLAKNNLVREIEKTFNGEISNDFWNNVSYFNLIQRLIPSLSNQDRPTYDDIKYGLLTFKKTVHLFDPDRIIFCGIEAAKHFENLLNDDNFRIEKHEFRESKINGAYPKSFALHFNGKKRLCHFIKHPSSHYSAIKWREFIFEK